MRLWTSHHTFDHPWETVVKAACRKYPNPLNPHVLGTDVIDRKVEDGVLYSHRLVSSQWRFPKWLTQQFIDKTVGCRLTKQSIQTAAVASSKFETFDKSKKKVQSKFRLEARENYKTTTPTVSTFIMSTPTNVMLFGNHPARRLRCGARPPLEPLSSSLDAGNIFRWALATVLQILISLGKHVSVDEVVTYAPHPENPETTLLSQQAVISIQGVPLIDHLERLLTMRIDQNAKKGRQAVEWVIEKFQSEMKDMTDDLFSYTKQGMEDLQNVAKKSFDEFQNLTVPPPPTSIPKL
ncbi:Protein slowmo [Melipona quadrifasciata]|uniref:Protein slowmo n=1 Tax=Melipona quadrifasciata TaxID=166423 RepID=A0A0N0BBB6_9HYME|nr:Protein slowmo [Melipona quadrifasciata]